MTVRRSVVALAVALVVGGAAQGASARPDPDVVAGSYIVTLRSGDPASVAARHAKKHGAAVTHLYVAALRGYSARLSPANAARIARDPEVATIVQDRYAGITAQVVPPGIDRVDADLSSAVAGDARGAVNVDVAIIDTGIDARHRDLDVVGGVNCVPGNRSSDDANGHGTHVAGTVAARDNRTGVVGVAPGARLWAVRVLNSQGQGTWSSIICGIDWVTAHADTIEVANMSLGGSAGEGSCSDGGMRAAICRSVSAGVTYVVSAGNSAADARYFAPESFDEVITVSAIAEFDGKPGGLGSPQFPYGDDDTFAFFSNYGADVDLTAPGVCVLSTWRGGGYNTISGTSMASPHVAGAAAAYIAGHPGSSPAQVKAALLAGGTDDWTGDPDSTKEPLVNASSF